MRNLLVLIFMVLPAAAWAQDIVPQQVGAVAAVEVRTPAFAPVEAGGTTLWQHEFNSFSGSESLRLHFSEISIPAGSAVELIVQDRGGTVVEAFGGPDAVAHTGHWSLPIRGDYARIAIVGSASPVGVAIAVDQVAYSTDPAIVMSIIETNELQEIVAYAQDPQVSRLARSVARLSFVRDGRAYVCSGFLIGGDRLMTNDHCIDSADVCASTVATFDYQRRLDGSLQYGLPVRCAEMLANDHTLDMTVVRLDRDMAAFGILQLMPDALVQGEALFIIQHPGGRPKMISRINCITSTPVADGYGSGTDLAHRCDTEGGSSGSPVFNAAGQVVALHHFGVGSGPMWNQNRAVRMSLILDRLAELGVK